MKKTIVREYRLQSPYIKEKQELTLAFLTDLHDQVTGEDGERIFQLLEKQHPDLVLVGGDVVVGKKGCETEKAFGFLKKLSETYPVYYASGNHEQRIVEHPEIYGEVGKRYEAAVEELPLLRLRNRKVQVEKKGIPLTICGLEPDERFYEKGRRKEGMVEELEKRFGQPDPDRITILLAHNPRYKKEYLSWGATVTFCGHYHGGVMMLGKRRGAISPDFRIFPGECGGIHKKGEHAVIVSAGLGEHTIPLRIHNPRELTILRICALQNLKIPVK